MYVAALTILLLGPGQTAPAEELSLGAITARLSERAAAVKSFSAELYLERRPTEKFVKEYAADTKSNVQSVRRQFSSSMQCRVNEVGSREFLADVQLYDGDGKKTSDYLIAYDGTEYWRESRVFTAEYPFSEVIVGRPEGETYVSLLPHKVCLGFGARNAFLPKTLAELVASSNATMVPSKDSLDTNVIRIHGTFTSGQRRNRFLICLEPQRGYCIQELQLHTTVEESGDWLPLCTFKSLAYEQTGLGDGNGTLFWYPSQVAMEVYNGRGEVTSIDTIRITSIRLNPPRSTLNFKPELKAGSTMRNAKTGKMWVHGGRPTPELEEAVRQSVKESKRRLEEAGAVDHIPAAEVPARWVDYLPGMVSTIGVLFVVAAAGMYLHSRVVRRSKV